MKLKIIHDEMLKVHFKEEPRLLIGYFDDKIAVSPDGLVMPHRIKGND